MKSVKKLLAKLRHAIKQEDEGVWVMVFGMALIVLGVLETFK